MSIFDDLTHRRMEPEIMDQPGLDVKEHARALWALGVVNRLGNTAGMYLHEMRAYLESETKRVRVLDIATGGGEVPIRLFKLARASGYTVEVDGCDMSGTAISLANEKISDLGGGMRFFVHNVVQDGVPEGYDVIISSAFFHHLTEAQVEMMLRDMAEKARGMVMISDLLRSRVGLMMVYFATRTLSRSPVVKTDGIISLKAAYTMAEMRKLMDKAGMERGLLKKVWPERLMIVWERSLQ